MKKSVKFGMLMVAILGTLAWLAIGGAKETSTYYKTVDEVKKMDMGSRTIKRLRVAGYVAPGTIVRDGRQVKFLVTQTEDAKTSSMEIIYDGSEPLPDTFRDGSQAVADGKMGMDGKFYASKIQAKCASKYESKPGAKPSANSSAAM